MEKLKNSMLPGRKTHTFTLTMDEDWNTQRNIVDKLKPYQHLYNEITKKLNRLIEEELDKAYNRNITEEDKLKIANRLIKEYNDRNN